MDSNLVTNGAGKSEVSSHKSHLAFESDFGLILGLTFAAVLGNFVLTSFYWDYNPEQIGELVLSAAIGLLITQVCLPAIWFGLSSGNLTKRIAPLSVFGVCLFSYLGTLLWLSYIYMPIEVVLVFVTASLSLFVMIQIPLLIMRRVKRIRVGRPDDVEAAAPTQFSIRQMLIATAIAAILATVVRAIASQLNSVSGFLAELGEISFFFAVIILFVSMLSLLGTAAVFSGKYRRSTCWLMFFVWVFGSAVVAWSICSGGVPFPTRYLTVFFNMLAFSGSLSIAVLGVLTLFYRRGHRAIAL